VIASIITLFVAFFISGYAVSHPRILAFWQPLQRTLTPALCVSIAAVLFALVLGGMAILRHLSFNSNALDMGLMDQIAWNSAHGRWLEESFIVGHPASFLGHHFSPVLVLIAPFYWLLPRPETLIILQVICIAGSALLLYRIAGKLSARPWVAVGFALVVLLHPLVQDGALFDFHQDALGMFFLALGLFGIVYRQWGWATLGWLLSLLAKEEIAIYWIAIGLFLLVVERHRRVGKALFVLLNALWLALVIAVLIPAFQGGSEPGFSFFERYAFWGGSVGQILDTITSRKAESLQFLLLPTRIGGLAMMLLPVLLFLLQSHWSILLLLVPLGINTLSDAVGQHNYRFHYSLLPIVIIVYASLWAFTMMQRKGFANLEERVQRATLFMLVAAVMLFVGVSQIGLSFPVLLQNYLPNAHDQLGERIIASLPAEASVIAQNKLVAHLSQRRNVTLLSRLLAEPADYYLLDLQSPIPPQSPEEYSAEITALLDNSTYGVVQLEDGYLLLARGAPHREADVEAAKKMVAQYPIQNSQ
jgi:uncharacterized membrane protein